METKLIKCPTCKEETPDVYPDNEPVGIGGIKCENCGAVFIKDEYKPTLTVRDLLLNRINNIKDTEQGFRKGTMRWDNFSTLIPNSKLPLIHISEFDFNQCDDIELVILFERVITRYFKQM